MKVLLIDDDTDICDALKARLPAEGFLVEVAHTGAAGIKAARMGEYDLCIVDLNLPDMGGEAIVARIRETARTPILVYSVVSDVDSRVRLLNSGADDFLIKDGRFFKELVARMRALVRRLPVLVPERIRIGDLVFDSAAQSVQRGGQEIPLTRKEFQILECLIRNQGVVIPKGVLIERIWDSSVDPFSDSFDTHLTNVRKKLGSPELIHTVRGRGYRIG